MVAKVTVVFPLDRHILISALQYITWCTGALVVYDYFLILDDEVCQSSPLSDI